ncbi:uncharacterized protein LOC101849157 [Aplysia californica]|uniref:Uncharacterized protein LOC101849157 n=1 Tax=Aplysia californica TaxID=6500 RepID=A0ABM1A8F3_APLCA|nr:uncharacterized protein LOC101849157 [Aplysia californica]
MHLYQTGHTGVFSAFSSPISLYGRLAVSVDVSPNPVNICPRTSHDVTVVCSVKFEDIYPEPVFQLYWGGQQVQNEKGKLRTDSYKKRYYTLVNHYTVNVNQAGSINFRCEVYNSVHTNEKASSNTLTVPVNAPPPSSPKLTISRGVYHGIQGYSVPMTPGQKYSASCDVSGGQPPVSSVTLTCPGVSQKTMSGTSVSLAGIVVAESADQEKCVCAAQHVSQCYNLRTEVTISVLFPPQTVTFERTDSDNNSPVDICSDSPQQIIRLQCRATFNPQPQFTILVNEQEYARSRPERVVGSGKNTYVYSYDFVPKAGGTYNTTCTANGDKTAPVESDQLTILVREPPQTEPEIIITNIGPSGNVSKNPEVVLNNTATNVTCLVDGGYPPVTSQDILLTCGNISGSEQITLPPGLSTDGEIACSCSASHITGCYSRSAHTRFKISALPLSTEASTDNSDVTVIASVGVAVVIVVVVVVVIVLVVRRRRRHSDRLSQDDPYVYPRDIALVTRPVDDPRRVTGQPTKMSNSTGRQRDRLSQDDTYLIPCDAPLATEPVDDPRRVTGQLTETGNSTSHQDENLYEEVDSDDTPPSDIHSPIPVMRTMAEIITIEAPTDPSPYNNVSASAPRSRAGQDGQGHITNPTGEYDVFPGPDSVVFLSDPYTSMKPENEYSQADEVDASYLSTQASSTGPEGYVSMEKIKNQGGSPYENE